MDGDGLESFRRNVPEAGSRIARQMRSRAKRVATDSVLEAQEDGLYVDGDVGPWVEDKHRLVSIYETMFSKGMKNKWETRVYIDLYSGPGMVRVRNTSKLLWGSPLLALQVKDQFDKYIFCENNGAAMSALKQRVKTHFPGADVSYVAGDCNGAVEKICAEIPPHSPTRKVLSFCFVDPYDLSLKFSTIRKIADRFVDFLTLLALDMDGRRNLQHYLDTANRKIDDFLGLADWRERWGRTSAEERVSFPKFLAELYAQQMRTLGYRQVEYDQMKPIRSDVRNLPLYRLALFSRHDLAYTYWQDVLKYSTSQGSLDLHL